MILTDRSPRDMSDEEYVRTYVERYDSLASFLETIERREVHPGWGTLSSDGRDDDEWYGGSSSFEDAVEKAKRGDRESASEFGKYMEEELSNFKARNSVNKPMVRNYFCGGSPNVTRAMMGLPKDMRQMHKVPQKVKTVELTMCTSVACVVDASKVKRAGSKFLAIAELLEHDGYSVRLNALNGVDPRDELGMLDGEEIGYTVAVKGYGEKLDVPKVAFMLANVGFFRRLGFRWLETWPHYRRESGRMSGYGWKYRDLVKRFRSYTAKHGGYVMDVAELADMDVRTWLDRNGFLA